MVNTRKLSNIMEKKVFKASWMTKSNFFFPTTLELTDSDLTYYKKKMIGSETRTLSYAQIASVVLTTGLMYADLLIESSGGHQIIAQGFRNSDAIQIKEIIDEGRRNSK